MRARLLSGSLVLAGAIALVGCAVSAPVSSTSASPSGAATAAAPAASGEGSSTPAKPTKTKLHGYELVVRNGTEYYCRYEPVVGSHTEREQICLTKEQIAQGEKSVDEFSRQIQDQAVNPAGMNPGARGR